MLTLRRIWRPACGFPKELGCIQLIVFFTINAPLSNKVGNYAIPKKLAKISTERK